MSARTCDVCGASFVLLDAPGQSTSTVTRTGRFGIVRKTVTQNGVVVHRCFWSPKSAQADRSLIAELLIRALEGPVPPLDVVRASHHRHHRDDAYLAIGLLADALDRGFVSVNFPPTAGDLGLSPLELVTLALLGRGEESDARVTLTDAGRLEANRLLSDELTDPEPLA